MKFETWKLNISLATWNNIKQNKELQIKISEDEKSKILVLFEESD